MPQFLQKNSNEPILSQSDDRNKIVIQKGEKVYILKTPKGCYLRTQDKKYIALRNKMLEDSFMLASTPPPNVDKNQTASYLPTNNQNFEEDPFKSNVAMNDNIKIDNANSTSQLSVQNDLPTQVFTSQVNPVSHLVSNSMSCANSQYENSSLDFNINSSVNLPNLCDPNANFYSNAHFSSDNVPNNSTTSSFNPSFHQSEYPNLSADNFQKQMLMIPSLMEPPSP